MSAVEAFSVEEISALLQHAEKTTAKSSRSLGEQLAECLRPLTSSGRSQRHAQGSAGARDVVCNTLQHTA
eukprot:CAMPEP_0179471106 /NCGR_PEP_ID=MMETSP0799-20121207/51413_1 /TAXON_ID=46947 /ORGANISM="Geminigera cryophila, Strain CCMP2564" /LENGTH=69 /DNA_ID=CAMNT_0021278539 /DNA_START=102 /DNA_END=308 /DNA_ORIENTATION=-